jgi:hypothetical protein
MKQLLGKLVNKLLSHLGKAALDIACLHEMGMSPRERDVFFGIVDPGYEQARHVAGVAHLKSEREAIYPGQVKWN